jgi:hypothetical protein
LIWTKEPLPELEDARKNALSAGEVQKTETAQRLNDFLQKYANLNLEISQDFADQNTILRGNSDVLVYRLELEHR